MVLVWVITGVEEGSMDQALIICQGSSSDPEEFKCVYRTKLCGGYCQDQLHNSQLWLQNGNLLYFFIVTNDIAKKITHFRLMRFDFKTLKENIVKTMNEPLAFENDRPILSSCVIFHQTDVAKEKLNGNEYSQVEEKHFLGKLILCIVKHACADPEDVDSLEPN